MRRAATLLAVLAVLAALAGCGGTSSRAMRLTLQALRAHADAASQPAHCGDPAFRGRPVAGLPSPAAIPPRSFMAAIQRHGDLVAGVDQNTLLFSYLNPVSGQLEGFEIDILREVARAIFGDPSRIVFKAVTTAQRFPALCAGTVDILADAVTITPERRLQIDFSTEYFDAVQKILVPSNSSVHGLADLAGKRVCATASSTSLATLTHLPPPAPIPYPVAQRTDCLVALQQGTVAAITSDDSILVGFQAQDPHNTRILAPVLNHEPYAMAISDAHPEFGRFVNGVLARMRVDGTWQRIWSRWLGPVLHTPPPAPPAASYAR